jgi:hypothetical protein
VSLKQAIEKQLGVPVKLKAGMPGSLDIYADHERIYSKPKSGPMPQPAEIVSALAQRQRA